MTRGTTAVERRDEETSIIYTEEPNEDAMAEAHSPEHTLASSAQSTHSRQLHSLITRRRVVCVRGESDAARWVDVV